MRPLSKQPKSPDVTSRPRRLQLARLRAALTELRGVLALQALTERARVELRHRWRGYVAQLVRRITRMVTADPQLFAWLKVPAAQLGEREEEIQDLQDLKAELECLLSDVNDTLLVRKGSLFDDVHGEVVEKVQAAIRSPLTDPPVAARMGELFRPVAALLEEYKDDRRAQQAQASRARAESEEKVAGLKEDLDNKTLENQILRGAVPPAGAVVQPAAGAPKTARRARLKRTTKR